MLNWFRDIVRAVVTVAKALWVTLRMWFVTYDPKRRTFTEIYEYPELPLVVSPRYRGFHRYDAAACIACGACVRDCPVSCIDLSKRKAEGRKGFEATGYVIDYTKCLFCGLCVESCPVDCLKMGSAYDMSCYSRDGCIVDFCRLPADVAWGQATLTPTVVAYQKMSAT